MAYFNELPNLEVLSRLPTKSSNEDYVTIKNLWRRPKLREDISNVVTGFYYYQIEEDERPDQIAEKIYGDPELDWVILVTNNITNLNEDWPLDNNSFYKYLLEKYGSDEEIYKVHHTETVEERDTFNRLVVPGNLQVDPERYVPSDFKTLEGVDSYILDGFPAEDNITKVSVNLIQALEVRKKEGTSKLYLIPDNQIDFSNLKVYTRDNNEINIRINNNLPNSWPSGWGGALRVYGRDEQLKDIEVKDTLSDIRIPIPPKLYEIKGDVIDDIIKPVFKFRYSEGDI